MNAAPGYQQNTTGGGFNPMTSYPQTPMTPASPFSQTPMPSGMRPAAAPFSYNTREEPAQDDFSNTESVGGGVSLDPAVYNNSRNGQRWGATRGMGRTTRGSRQ